MNIDRRYLFAAVASAASVFGVDSARATSTLAHRARDARAAEPADEMNRGPAQEAVSRTAIEGTSLGLRPNAAEDQSNVFQHAIDYAAGARAMLHLAPGFYRAGSLRLPPFAAIAGVPGATRILMTGGPSLMWATGSDHIRISGLVLDGIDIPLPERRGLVHLSKGSFVRVADCEIVNAGGNGVSLEGIAGEISSNTISAADAAIFSVDARRLRIAGNAVLGAGNGGILIWRSEGGDDGTLVIDNHVEEVGAKAGGSGEHGNAINVFRANNVIVRGNRIRNAAFSAVRGNAASNLQIVGNTCSGLGEAALYAEFGFEGAVIANNVVDGAALGISVTNFNEGGRLAIVQGNLIRNLTGRRPPGTDPSDTAGIGIGVEADTVVTGNIVERAPNIGISVGWGPYLRDVAVTSNVIRAADYGIAVSVAPGAGAAVIADNLISEVRRYAIVGMEWNKAVTSDLSQADAGRYPQLSIVGNRVR